MGWARRLANATAVAPANQLYCGRNFAVSSKTADALRAPLYIVSAGLGLIHANDVVPSYGLTVAAGSPDSILAKITKRFSAGEWWSIGAARSPFSRGICTTLEVFRNGRGLLLLALPGSYLRMIQHELLQLPESLLSRVRLFSGATPVDIDPRLRGLIMPYDGRLDGRDSAAPGTTTDFAARALADFSQSVLPAAPQADAEAHRDAVSHRLAKWAQTCRPDRARHTDDQLLHLIREDWREGSSASSMLRLFRDERGIACEQARFGRLFARVQSGGGKE